MKLNEKKLSRGLRNNNPCNLIITKNKWVGKIEKSEDEKFEQFLTMELGIRAAIISISNQIKKGKITIERLITNYAPSNENDTHNYINLVCKMMNMTKNEVFIETAYEMFKLIKAIIIIENGIDAEKIKDETIVNAIKASRKFSKV